ncbi:hypothetical protein OB955_20640 [Halobacteria archaeon AArc-m2/3/4]|uniref:Small CPxCG-related zinc finger protein n=1 Tax=Natronoglomus mannanivorans TaxID=2979990 RepID=A0AAP2YYV1_9EURY|nr:hypothetical protein [Halobacteria archaeon AArc-xg1-1]MCU4975111.1 hypothetical protein [Halobacteria archaeon AArc-m2/3/4]
MPTCKQCGSTLETADLVRHEAGDLLMVHCPECQRLMGTYREPGYNR